MSDHNPTGNDTEGQKADTLNQVRQALDDSTELPGPLRSQLRQARHQALQARQHRRRHHAPLWYGVAASFILAALIGLLWPGDLAEQDASEDMLWAMAELEEDEWALIQELEFVYWLSEQPHEALDVEKRPDDQPG